MPCCRDLAFGVAGVEEPFQLAVGMVVEPLVGDRQQRRNRQVRNIGGKRYARTRLAGVASITEEKADSVVRNGPEPAGPGIAVDSFFVKKYLLVFVLRNRVELRVHLLEELVILGISPLLLF